MIYCNLELYISHVQYVISLELYISHVQYVISDNKLNCNVETCIFCKVALKRSVLLSAII